MSVAALPLAGAWAFSGYLCSAGPALARTELLAGLADPDHVQLSKHSEQQDDDQKDSYGFENHLLAEPCPSETIFYRTEEIVHPRRTKPLKQ